MHYAELKNNVLALSPCEKLDTLRLQINELFFHKGIDAGLAAGIFHQKLLTIRELKEYLNENGVEMRL